MQEIAREWLEPLWYGSIFLGSGGGGKSHLLAIELQKALQNRSIPLLSLEELPENDFFCGTGLFGSPELCEENLPSGFEAGIIIEELEKHTGVKFKGITIVEGAGVNIFYPLLAALQTGLPVVDGDSMGRAFPELQMTTYHLENLTAAPLVLIDGNYHLHYFLDKQDTFLLELNTRQIIGQQGGIGYFAGFPYPGSVLKRVLLPGTLTFAREIGECFLQADNYRELITMLLEVTSNSFYGPVIELFQGIVKKISTYELAKWKSATLTSPKGEELQLLFQYENLLAFKNGNVAASVPDLISAIDLNELKPVNNNEIYEGQRLALLGLPAPLRLRIKKALDVVGPQCFGYRTTYLPLERLYPNHYRNKEVFS
ncbi:DUF917 domain-containing protein [Carboxydothermus ferrireducens]|uniref:DUF917 family protein n=1 Tax=Carboxydothermus ferrireducens DSM 11255 TaxID=1119529 RepID=A0ABX2RA91_9THEO|nr:DUF917 domain-containing protein [Carboxydothermus ferrireducens]NYE58101.1 DUF917 family protein [Carboxydothermus ferrireducens DSM 11255]